MSQHRKQNTAIIVIQSMEILQHLIKSPLTVDCSSIFMLKYNFLSDNDLEELRSHMR